MRIAMFLRQRSNRKPSRRQRLQRRVLSRGFEQLDARRVLAAITGVVYADLDLSGVQETGETGLEDRIVYIDQNHNDRLDTSEPYRRTNSSGAFEFQDLSTATGHTLRMFDGSGTQNITSPGSGDVLVVFESDESVVDVSFGVEVIGENEAPTSAPVDFESKQGLSFLLMFPNGLVWKYGSDAPNHTFVAIQTSESENGNIAIDLSGGARYTALEDFVGQDVATYVLHDGRNASDPLTMTVDVIAKDAPLQGVVVEGDPLSEHAPEGTEIGNLKVLTPGLHGNVRFETDDPRVRIEGNLLILADPEAINFEWQPELRVPVRLIDLETNEEISQPEVVIQIADEDDPVTMITGPEYGDTTEYAMGTEFGFVVAEDEDSWQMHEFNVDDSRFEVDGNILKLRDDESLSYPEDDGLVINVSVDDSASGGDPVSTSVTITVYNVNDPPTAVNVSGELRERTFGGHVGPITVVDPDPSDGYIFTISDSRFEVVDGILKLLDDTSVVYNPSSPSISLTITATETTDAQYSVDSEVTISIIENPSPWQNLPESLDVNNDGVITPQDVLIILNSLNEGGPRPLGDPFDGGNYIDVNGDGLLTPLDALLVINELNSISNLRTTPGGGFPPIGEAEQQPGEPLPVEGEKIVVSPKTVPEGESQPHRNYFASPLASQQLLADDSFDEDEDWLEPSLDDLFV